MCLMCVAHTSDALGRHVSCAMRRKLWIRMRHGELIGLRWEDVDLVAGRITVRRNVVNGKIGAPKSGKAREIALGVEVRRRSRSIGIFADRS
jgi:integrase